MSDTDGAVRFAPRRLGHANLFVGNLEKSLSFYNKVGGLDLVRLEPEIVAAFLSAGTSHHDIGLMEVSKDARVGLSGHVQIPASRGRRPGLNHFGWEMETESHLVAAYRRAKDASIRIHRTTNHQISHSVYVFDPEGNLNEFYADALEDWRTIFNLEHEDLVSSHWDPEARKPDERPFYDPSPRIVRVTDAIFHPISIMFGVLAVKNLERVAAFYREVAGLAVKAEKRDRAVVLTGAKGGPDLVLVAAGGKLSPGLHHAGFLLDGDEGTLKGEMSALKAAGVDVLRFNDEGSRKSILIADPDGILLEFIRSPDAKPATALDLDDVVDALEKERGDA